MLLLLILQKLNTTFIIKHAYENLYYKKTNLTETISLASDVISAQKFRFIYFGKEDKYKIEKYERKHAFITNENGKLVLKPALDPEPQNTDQTTRPKDDEQVFKLINLSEDSKRIVLKSCNKCITRVGVELLIQDCHNDYKDQIFSLINTSNLGNIEDVEYLFDPEVFDPENVFGSRKCRLRDFLNPWDSRMVSRNGRMNSKGDRMNSMDSRMNARDGRLDARDGRLDAGDGRLNARDGRLAAGDGRLDAGDGRMNERDNNINSRNDRLNLGDNRIGSDNNQINRGNLRGRRRNKDIRRNLNFRWRRLLVGNNLRPDDPFFINENNRSKNDNGERENIEGPFDNDLLDWSNGNTSKRSRMNVNDNELSTGGNDRTQTPDLDYPSYFPGLRTILLRARRLFEQLLRRKPNLNPDNDFLDNSNRKIKSASNQTPEMEFTPNTPIRSIPKILTEMSKRYGNNACKLIFNIGLNFLKYLRESIKNNKDDEIDLEGILKGRVSECSNSNAAVPREDSILSYILWKLLWDPQEIESEQNDLKNTPNNKNDEINIGKN
ncbi:hypothetical protein COBT_000844 [Conglomerata obtusa]